MQLRSNPALLLSSTGETPRLWSARSLHSTAAKAAASEAADAATAEAAEAATNGALIYEVVSGPDALCACQQAGIGLDTV